MALSKPTTTIFKFDKESADSLDSLRPYVFMISEVHSFELSWSVNPKGFVTYEFELVDEPNCTPVYLIRLVFELGYVKVELKRYKESLGYYVELYSAKGGLAAPSLTTLKVLVSNIHTTSAVSFFSEGLRQLGFEGE